jgi:hypothetical protein
MTAKYPRSKQLPSISDTHVTTPEAAYMLGISTGCLREWRYRGDKAADFLPFTKIGGRFWYAVTDIEAFLESHTTRKTYIRKDK